MTHNFYFLICEWLLLLLRLNWVWKLLSCIMDRQSSFNSQFFKKIIKMCQVYWKSLGFLFHFQISKLKNICEAIAFSFHYDSRRFSTLIDVLLIGREIIVSKNNCKFSSTIDFLCLLVVSANYLFDIFGVYWL